MKKRLISICLLLFVVPFAGLLMMNWFSKPPSNLGVTNGRLAACPDSPNCVSTQASDEIHQADPIPFNEDASLVMQRLKSAIGSMPRAKIVEETENYLRCEFTTAIMRYVDDVELLIDGESKVIHFRSASRIGHSDMGANRKRMADLRAILKQRAW